MSFMTREDLNEIMSKGLWDAAGKGDLDRVVASVGMGADVDFVGSNDTRALHIAAANGHAGIVKFLLGRGARVDVQNILGVQPLHMAAHHGHLEVIELLLDAGAPADAGDHDDYSPLHWGAWNGQKSAVKLLLERGANPAITSRKGEKPADICKDTELKGLLDAAVLEWQSPHAGLSAHLKRQRKLGALRPKGPSL